MSTGYARRFGSQNDRKKQGPTILVPRLPPLDDLFNRIGLMLIH